LKQLDFTSGETRGWPAAQIQDNLQQVVAVVGFYHRRRYFWGQYPQQGVQIIGDSSLTHNF
jgi:hypothetical protein